MSGWEHVRFETAGVLGRGFLASLFATVRCSREGQEHYQRFRERGEPVIFAVWHGQLLPLAHYHRNEGIVVLVSEHADGEYITRVIRHYGFGTARGSSTRGGVKGLRALIRAARAGHDLGITPDGPRGPAREVKWGVLATARSTGLPIVPMATRASRAWELGSWDGFMVPKPFSRIHIAYGPPRRIERRADEKTLRAQAAALGAELNRLTSVAEGVVGPTSKGPEVP